MKDYPRWDWLTFAVRFTCGALVGVAIGVAIYLRIHRFSPDFISDLSDRILAFVVIGVAAGLSGLFAWWYGDRFWEGWEELDWRYWFTEYLFRRWR